MPSSVSIRRMAGIYLIHIHSKKERKKTEQKTKDNDNYVCKNEKSMIDDGGDIKQINMENKNKEKK